MNTQAWHVAINEFSDGKVGKADWPHFMYYAKDASLEVERLALLFAMERTGGLPKHHYQCSHDLDGAPVPDNHLSCCLGTECRVCPFLKALDTASATAEDIDKMKAWTCVTHILVEAGKRDFLDVSEGFVMTTDDRMYWEHVYKNMAGWVDEDDE